MSNTDLIKELRALTSAGMKDCKDALEEANWDLQKAVDLVKIKGLNIADGRSGKVAAEGIVLYGLLTNAGVMVEVNCQTDFVANSPEFRKFAMLASVSLSKDFLEGKPFQHDSELLETARKDLVAKTKENIVIRRWWIEEAQSSMVRVFSYLHSNQKIGVLISMQAPSETIADSSEFKILGEELAMQIAAMNPLAVSPDRLPTEEQERQKVIFETQLKEANKPEAVWPKIMEGKFRKWNTEVCLLEQESVVLPKTTVKQVIKDVGTKLGGEIVVVNFIRCQVGEGIVKKQENLAEEVAKLTGMEAEVTPAPHHHSDGFCDTVGCK